MFEVAPGEPLLHDNLMSQRWLLQCGLILIWLAWKVMCSAVFEVSLLKLNNNRGVTYNGRCCSGLTTSPPCSAECRTFLTACLMHYTKSMPLHRSCTYGTNKTGILGSNNIRPGNGEDDLLIQIPVDISWPGKFTLILEAWHHTGVEQPVYDSTQLIAQAFVSNTVLPSEEWTNDTTFSPTTELAIRYRLLCQMWYHGESCDTYCRPRDQPFGGHYSCDEGGNKLCKPGWQGDFCDRPRCSSECMRNRGTCDRPFECRCRLGWQGPNCGQCRPYSGCLRGYCLRPYQCICEDGWKGQLCDIDTTYCQRTQPCDHGGTCISDHVGNYTCLCPPGFGGDNCQFPLCFPGFCKNGGVCQTRRGARECVCIGDFYGDNCEHRKLTCEELACKHGATCVRDEYSASCACPEGYTGTRCETKIHPCSSNPCENDAECRANDMSKLGFSCSCRLGFGGLYCSIAIDPCSGTTCYNGGRCLYIEGQDIPTCRCAKGFRGQYCELSNDLCAHVHCLNGGSCKPSPMGNGFICQCTKGYHGEVCESEMNPCESSPCRNGGTCKNYISSFLCVCAEGYSGKYCESKKFTKEKSEATVNVAFSDDVHAEIKENETIDTNNSRAIVLCQQKWNLLTTLTLIFLKDFV